MEIPKDLLFTPEHEWIRVEGNNATIGVTHFAQDQLGDVVFVELPEVGRQVKQFEALGVVESVKTVSDIYAPASGKVTAVNAELESKPELVNSDSYGAGWMVKIELESPAETEGLLGPDKYQEQINQESA